MKMSELQKLESQSLANIANLSTLDTLEETRVNLLGKTGEITQLLKQLGSMPAEERKSFGQAVNQVKVTVQAALDDKKEALELVALEAQLASEGIDVTLPSKPHAMGKMHPISYVIEEVGDVLHRLGFEHALAPEMETDFYNFTALNIPEDHPARQDHDTFYVKPLNEEEERLVLRTQTSNAQIHTMEKYEPPLRIMSIGRVYRRDSDMTHTPQFHQIEGLAIDKDIHFGHLKGTLQKFLNEFFEREMKMRFRPHYFPFTEPSMEVDVEWTYEKNGEKHTKWLELLGSGMVHRNVLNHCNIDHEKYQGFAFGCGVERLAMLKYGINDLRMFFESHAQFLQHFGKSSVLRRD